MYDVTTTWCPDLGYYDTCTDIQWFLRLLFDGPGNEVTLMLLLRLQLLLPKHFIFRRIESIQVGFCVVVMLQKA